MATIYKYKLQPGRTVLDLPDGAKVLTVQMQGDDACLWALVEPHKPTGSRFFDVYGTGHPAPADPGDYVATFQQRNAWGALVFHVFDATRTESSASFYGGTPKTDPDYKESEAELREREACAAICEREAEHNGIGGGWHLAVLIRERQQLQAAHQKALDEAIAFDRQRLGQKMTR